MTPLEAERVLGGVLQLDYWAGRAAEAERCAKLGKKKKQQSESVAKKERAKMSGAFDWAAVCG